MKKKFLLKHQAQFIQAPGLFIKSRFFMLIAGYGAGKSSAIATLVEYYVHLLQGKTDTEGHPPTIVLGGVTLAHLEKTTLAMIKGDFDNSKTIYTHDKKNNVITVGTVRIVLVSLSDPQKIVGFNAYVSIGDEIDDLGNLTQSDDVTFEAVRALNERTRQVIKGMRKPFLCFGTTSQGQKGMYRVYTNFVKTKASFVLIRGSTRDNPYNDKDYVDSLYRMYNKNERLVYLEGHFLAISQGRVLGDFDWDRNYIESDMDQSVTEDETVYWAQDFNTGYFRGVVGVVRDGKIYIVKSYDFPVFNHAPSVVRHDFPHSKIILIPDTTAKDMIKNIQRELKKFGIKYVIRSKNPLVEDSVFLVNKLFYTRRLTLSSMAKDAAEACALAQRNKEGKVPKGIGPNSPIHYCLTGDTPVLTSEGWVPIKDVKAGNKVLTRKGWRNVTLQLHIGKKKVQPLAGIGITPEHPVWTEERGMTARSLLTDFDSTVTIDPREANRWVLEQKTEDLLLECIASMSRSLNGAVLSGTGIPTRNGGVTVRTIGAESGTCMSVSGSLIMGLFLQGMMCTTKIQILRTTALRILSACLEMCTGGSRSVSHKKYSTILKRSGHSRKPGTQVRRGWQSTAESASSASRPSSPVQSKSVANTVAVASRLLQYLRQGRSSAVQTAKTPVGSLQAWMQSSGSAKVAERLSRHRSQGGQDSARQDAQQGIDGEVDVYDISVEGEHEYFANGVLVSNCDGVRMLCYYLTTTKRSLRDMRRVTIARHEAMMEPEKGVVEQEGGYAEINPQTV